MTSDTQGVKSNMAQGRSNLSTPREVAEALRISVITCYRMIWDGRIPAVRAGRQWRVPTEVLEELLSSGVGLRPHTTSMGDGKDG